MPATPIQPARKPPVGLLPGGEFHIYRPDPAAAAEEVPGGHWQGSELPFIMSNSHVPMAPLEPSLEKLFQSIWKEANANTAAPHRVLAGQQRLAPQMTIGRQRIAPAPEPAYKKIPNLVTAPKFAEHAAHLQGTARDWVGMLSINRVVAYCFRGDSRDHTAIKAAGGFFPPSTRNDRKYLEETVFPHFRDYMKRRFGFDIPLSIFMHAVTNSMDVSTRNLFLEYSLWRALVATEELHLGRMLANEALKGYISTSRAVTTAKAFACDFGKRDGYVYAVLVRGGYLVPTQAIGTWTEFFNEQEVAYPGPILWPDVVGWRQVRKNGMFTPGSPVFLRTDFYKKDAQAAEQVFVLLSGQRQL